MPIRDPFTVTFQKEEARSATPRATVSSKGRGRSVADLIEHFEKVAPEAVQKKGLSSAAFRAGELIRAMRKGAGYHKPNWLRSFPCRRLE